MPDMSIPSRDAQLLLWAQAFATGIEKQPAAFALSPSDAETIWQAVNDYATKLLIATEPLTRTAGTVNAKDTARNSMVALLRVYMSGIRANRGISDQQKIDIGIHIAKTYPTARACPQTSPALGLRASTPGRVNLSYTDSLSPSVKAKPFGAHRLELVGVLVDVDNGEAIPSGPPENPIIFGSFTRSRFTIDAPRPPKPMHLFLWGRWAGARGEVGPWSLGLHGGVFSKHVKSEAAPKKAATEAQGADDAGPETLPQAA